MPRAQAGPGRDLTRRPGNVAGPGRRLFLRGALGAGAAGAAGLVAGTAGGYAVGASRSAPGGLGLAEDGWAGQLPAVPFHGRYQPGILAKPSRRTIVTAFTVTAASRAGWSACWPR